MRLNNLRANEFLKSMAKIVDYSEEHKNSLEKLLLALVNHVARFNSLRREQADSRFPTQYLENLQFKLVQHTAIIKVAVDDKEVIGFIVGVIKERTVTELLEFKSDKVGFISDLFVEPSYRNKGIASLLMQEVESSFKKLGCVLIEINVVIENAPAHSLYQKLGFSDHDVTMRKVIASAV